LSCKTAKLIEIDAVNFYIPTLMDSGNIFFERKPT